MNKWSVMLMQTMMTHFWFYWNDILYKISIQNFSVFWYNNQFLIFIITLFKSAHQVSYLFSLILPRIGNGNEIFVVIQIILKLIHFSIGTSRKIIAELLRDVEKTNRFSLIKWNKLKSKYHNVKVYFVPW